MIGRPARWLIAIGISVALAASLATLVIYRIGTGIAASVEHKSAKTTTATVVSVTDIRTASSPGANSNDQVLRVCFTIDNFDQVEADMRQGYQSAETQRLTKDGPRCKLTSEIALAKGLSKGDKLSVVYLLENEYQIDLVRTTAHGKEL